MDCTTLVTSIADRLNARRVLIFPSNMLSINRITSRVTCLGRRSRLQILSSFFFHIAIIVDFAALETKTGSLFFTFGALRIRSDRRDCPSWDSVWRFAETQSSSSWLVHVCRGLSDYSLFTWRFFLFVSTLLFRVRVRVMTEDFERSCLAGAHSSSSRSHLSPESSRRFWFFASNEVVQLRLRWLRCRVFDCCSCRIRIRCQRSPLEITGYRLSRSIRRGGLWEVFKTIPKKFQLTRTRWTQVPILCQLSVRCFSESLRSGSDDHKTSVLCDGRISFATLTLTEVVLDIVVSTFLWGKILCSCCLTSVENSDSALWDVLSDLVTEIVAILLSQFVNRFFIWNLDG